MNKQSSSISQLINEYMEYIQNMNNILEEIHYINSMEFKLLEKDLTKLEFDENNSKLLIVRLIIQPNLMDKPIDWVLVLYLDTEDIFSYPHKIIMEPMIRVDVLKKINPIKWIGNRRIYDNLLNLFEEILN